MTEKEVTIVKNAVLDATEAYVDARLEVLDYVKTQIGTVINYVQGKYTKIIPRGNENPHDQNWYEYNKNTYTYFLTSDTSVQLGKNYYKYKNDKKYYHNVKCDDGRVTYNNVLSVGNTPFPANSVVFLIAPNAQFSNQFILGKLDDTPIHMTAGSIDIGNGNFVVTDQGVMTARQGTFEGTVQGSTIIGGEINIGNGVFTVDQYGNMIATTGEIGDLILGGGSLYATGYAYITQNKLVSATKRASVTKLITSFIPANMGLLSNFKLTLDYDVVIDVGRTATVKLQRKSGSSWIDVTGESYPLNTSTSGTVDFGTTFGNNNRTTYRIVIVFDAITGTYNQRYRCTIHTTDKAIMTALTTEGYYGKINSSNAIISGITLSSGAIDSTDEYQSDGFYLSENSLIINDDGFDLLTYSPYGTDSSYYHAGLFVGNDDHYTDVGIVLSKNSNNYLYLQNDGYYEIYVNGTPTYGSLINGSDERIKEDITPLEVELSKNLINKTNTYKFKYKNIDGYHYGVIAQEARKVLDNLGENNARLEYGAGNTNIEDQRNVNYQEYIPPLINCYKDLQKRVEELEKRTSK